MKMRRWLAVAALLALPAWALAQVVANDGASLRGQTSAQAVGGMVRADNSMKMLTMDADGMLRVSESSPIFDMNGVAQNVIGPINIAAAGAESSAVIVSHRWRVAGLMIKAVPSTGVGGINRFAVQIRAHLSQLPDSANTFVWYPQASTTMGGDASIADTTLAVGHHNAGSGTAPWSGEFNVVVNRNRNAPADGVAATAFHYPSGIYIPLSNWQGTYFWAPYMSVRVRNMVGPTCNVTVHVVGTPL